MATFISFPILILITILQSSIASRLTLLQGSADLMLLVLIAWALQERVQTAWQWTVVGGLLIGFVSILNTLLVLGTYAAIIGLVLLVRRRIWGFSLLVMFALTLFGSIFSQGVFALALTISGTPLPFVDSLRLVVLPGLVLNLLLAAPIYAIIKDLAEWVYPEEILS